jgi:hypothetical protein
LFATATTAAAAAEAAATAATAAFTTATTTTSAGAFRTGAGDVDVQRASIEFIAIEGGNRVLALLIVVHFNKGETARTPGIPIGHDADTAHGAKSLERGPQVCFRRLKRQISNKYIFQLISFKTELFDLAGR